MWQGERREGNRSNPTGDCLRGKSQRAATQFSGRLIRVSYLRQGAKPHTTSWAIRCQVTWPELIFCGGWKRLHPSRRYGILLEGMSVEKVQKCLVASVVSHSLPPHKPQPARFHCLWDSPGKNTGMGCHALLQGICPTRGSTPHLLLLLHYRRIIYC